MYGIVPYLCWKKRGEKLINIYHTVQERQNIKTEFTRAAFKTGIVVSWAGQDKLEALISQAEPEYPESQTQVLLMQSPLSLQTEVKPLP